MIEKVENSKKLVSITKETLHNEVFENWYNLKKTLTIGVVTYSQNYLLKTLINSFQSQTSDDWKMIIVHDGPIDNDLYQSLLKNKYLADERIVLLTTESRFDDYGHSLRNIILENYITTSWLLLTNGDNYYAPIFVQNMVDEINKDPDIYMVAYPAVLHNFGNPLEPDRVYNVAKEPHLSVGGIDMGQFIVRKEVASEFRINPTVIGDGEFCLKCVRYIKSKNKKIHRTYSVDFMHNV